MPTIQINTSITSDLLNSLKQYTWLTSITACQMTWRKVVGYPGHRYFSLQTSNIIGGSVASEKMLTSKTDSPMYRGEMDQKM
jgi:hypothetical protein